MTFIFSKPISKKSRSETAYPKGTVGRISLAAGHLVLVF